VSALRELYRYRRYLDGFNIILFDKRCGFEFLPVLPDIIGGRVSGDRLNVDLGKFCKKHNCSFINKEITGVELEKNEIKDSGGIVTPYEYLIISSGSRTNFFDMDHLKENCFKLDSIEDAVAINKELLARSGRDNELNVIVIGGGYTGIEITANVYYLFMKIGKKCRIHIIDKAPDILMMVPGWMRKYVRNYLERVRINIKCNDSLKAYDGKTATLESGEELNDAFCIWAPGVKTSDYVNGLPGEKAGTRIKVDPFLNIQGSSYEKVFVAGDSAAFYDEKLGQPIRMAVMFSMGQGKIAARNVVSSIMKRPLKKYKAIDMGYLVPLAFGKAPGIILNVPVKGRLGYFMHYFMCIYRSEWQNKFGMLKDLIVR